MNKTVTKVMIAILISLLLITISTSCFALEPNQLTGSNTTNGVNEITKLGNSVITILQTVGIVLSVIVIIVIGIKYMMGSAEEKAEYKKTMIPYLVGAALIFAASVFAQVIFKFFTGIK